MMTLVLNTGMKLKAGMVERRITAAKAKCPKCTKPFGNLPLQSLDLPAAT